MTKHPFLWPAWLILCAFAVVTSGQKITGKYSTNRAKNNSTIDIREDSTYVQVHFSVIDSYGTEGRWRMRSDTLILDFQKVYAIEGKKKTLVTDTKSLWYDYAKQTTKYLIKQDTLIQLIYTDTKVLQQKLTRVKK